MPFVTQTEARSVQMFPGVSRRVLATSERMMVVEVSLAAGAEVPAHTHPHEQIGYVAKGRLRFRAGEQERELAAGDSYLVPGGVEHHVRTLEDAIAIDIFSPPREDFYER